MLGFPKSSAITVVICLKHPTIKSVHKSYPCPVVDSTACIPIDELADVKTVCYGIICATYTKDMIALQLSVL